jgi:two-component system response regulator NreC
VIRIVIVDDHAVVRSGLSALLEKNAEFEVVAEAQDGKQAVEVVLEKRPDVTLMDITLGELDGVEATRRILTQWPQARILALTMHEEDQYLIPFLEAGGVGYVMKSAADRDLLQAIKQVTRGEVFLHQSGLRRIVEEQRGSEAGHDPPDLAALSDREQQVLVLTVRGFTSREIGEQLSLSPRTIETYRERMMQKLGLKHRSELVEFALRHQLLE